MPISTDLHRVFCAAMRKRRQELGISQVSLAASLGWSQPTVSQLESGDGSPSLDRVERIAKALQFGRGEDLLAYGRLILGQLPITQLQQASCENPVQS